MNIRFLLISAAECNLLQSDKLGINASKRKLLRLSRISKVVYNYYELNDMKTECVTQFKNVGALIDYSHLSIVSHICSYVYIAIF